MIDILFRLRYPLLGAAAAALVFVTTSAVAGSGVGDVFNLGQTNTVDGTSTLTGTTAGTQLKVQNASTAAATFSVFGLLTPSAPGAGSAAVRGTSNGTGGTGYGVWGSQLGSGIGVYGSAPTGTGVSGYHTGSTGTGSGVQGRSNSASAAGVYGLNAAGGPGVRVGTGNQGLRVDGPAGLGGTAISVGGYGKVAVDAPFDPGGRFALLDNGNVGIGEPNPSYKLHVGVGDSGLRVEGPANPGGTAMSIGGYGEVRVDAPGTAGGRFVVKDGGNVGIGQPNPQAKLHIRSTSTNADNNTAEFDAPNIGPNASHIHWGTTGDWYIRSAADGGKVVMQDTPGNVGIGTASPGEKLSVAGKVESTSGGFKFPDGSTQTTAAPNAAYTTYSAPSLDTREIADVDDPAPTELAHLDLPAGTYLLMATADFSNGAGLAFQDNSRLVKCTFFDQEFRFKIEPGGGGFFGRSTSTWQSVKILGSPTTVSLSCRAYTGGTDRSYVYGNATRITAMKLASITVQ